MAACRECKRNIGGGTDMRKKAIIWRMADGSEETSCNQDGIEEPTGTKTLAGVMHYKCWKIKQKHRTRGGDDGSGRRMGKIPTAYEIAVLTANQDDLAWLGITEEEARELNTRQLTERVERQQAAMIARAAASEKVSVEEMYAQVRLAAQRLEREKDPSYKEPEETDWRTQHVLDVRDVPPPGEVTEISDMDPEQLEEQVVVAEV